MALRNFKELIVWQRSVQLAKIIHVLTEQLPKSEIYGLMSQMRRCAISIPSNIAEGTKRSTAKDFLQFLRIADGSCSELETQLLLTKELFPGTSIEQSIQVLTEIQKMLGGMIKGLFSPL